MTTEVMERGAGTRFGPYEIVAPLGSGGMGEVFRATDLRLHRDVALKILSGEGHEDAHRQQRFLQEARAASALNHPNILSVYDVGDENGSRYIVSELVEGESLRSLVQKGALPLRRFLDIAIQVASGLTAAHEAGIVHRDLKPENIMVGRENRVKLLDFGLAKVLIPRTGTPEEETQSHLLTMPGAILGTVAYMSPEQARGEEIDFRSDQFSFGLILYEMATGKKAFHKDTPVQTLSAIIAEDPPSINTLNSRFPAPIRWMIERCLAKDRRDRYGATIDLYHELRDYREHLSEASFSGETSPVAPKSRKRRAAFFASAGILLALLGGFLLAAALIPRDVVPLSSYRFTPLAVNPEMETGAVWSPDGKSIVYVAEVQGVMQLFLRSLSSPIATQVTQSANNVISPYWSPDGSRIYYTIMGDDLRPDLWAVGVGGGSPELVMAQAGGGSISPDGQTLVFFRAQKGGPYDVFTLWTSSPPGAEPKQYKEGALADLTFGYADVQFSPDGSKMLLFGKSEKMGDSTWLIPVNGGAPEELTFLKGSGGAGFSWMPDSRRVIVSRGGDNSHHLWMADLESRTVRPITTGVQEESDPSVSPDGRRILFSSYVKQYDLAEVPLDGTAIRHLTETPVNEKAPAWSPSGGQFAFVSDVTGSDVIWVRSEAEGWQRPLVTEKDFPDHQTVSFSRPFFSPDGQRIAYHRNVKKGGAQIWISSISGGSPVRVYADEGRFQFTPAWSPDGNWIAFLSGSTAGLRLEKARIGSSSPPVILKESVLYLQPQWSPDGNWICFMRPEGVFLISEDGKQEKQIGKETWLTGGWSKDGKSLYAVRQDEKRHLLVTATDLQTGRERLISDAGVSPILITEAVFAGFTLAPDGQSFATSVLRTRSDIWILEDFDPKPRSLFWFLRPEKVDGKEKTS